MRRRSGEACFAAAIPDLLCCATACTCLARQFAPILCSPATGALQGCSEPFGLQAFVPACPQHGRAGARGPPLQRLWDKNNRGINTFSCKIQGGAAPIALQDSRHIRRCRRRPCAQALGRCRRLHVHHAPPPLLLICWNSWPRHRRCTHAHACIARRRCMHDGRRERRPTRRPALMTSVRITPGPMRKWARAPTKKATKGRSQVTESKQN